MSDLKNDIAPSSPFNGLHALQSATPFFAIRNRPHRQVENTPPKAGML